MLAHNINYAESSVASTLSSSSINWTNFGNKVIVLLNNPGYSSGVLGRPIVGTPSYLSPGICKAPSTPLPDYTDPNWTGCPSQSPGKVSVGDTANPEHPVNYFKHFSTEEWLAALVGDGTITSAQSLEVKLMSENMQILRDRNLGFKQGYVTGDLGGGFNPNTGIWTNPSGSAKVGSLGNGATLPVGCDPLLFSQGNLVSSNSKKSRLGLSLITCSTDPTPKYPALYYIFPRFDHSQIGKDDTSNTPAIDHTQPLTEEFFQQGSSYSGSYIESVNASIAGNSNIYEAVDVSAIALTPHAPNETAWRTPARSLSAHSDFNFNGPLMAPSAAFDDSADDNPGNVEKNLSQNIIGVSNGSTYDFYQTSFLDKAIMDGRELLTVRLMDVDIDLLTNVDTAASSDDVDADIKVGGKAWIREDSGIVYAFREDSVREDGIVRPYSSQLNNNPETAWNACKTVEALTAPVPTIPNGTTGHCHMDVSPAGPYDPPLNSQTGISPKPVDMVADPMRRPYGFRLINGKSLNRPTVTGNVQSAGMTFVTDNPVYIKGDFNLHAQKSA
ncbi:MAG: hypothetical protein AAFR97_12760, partial [Bacteroidota bacterium]